MKNLGKKEFLEILKRYQEHTATQEEIAFLRAYYNVFENSDDYVSRLSSEEDKLVNARLKNKIERSIQMAETAPRTGLGRRLNRGWLKAAAAIVILAGTTVYFYTSANKPEQTVATAAPGNPSEILPGKTHAVLTLADGRKVTLDDASGPEIAKTTGIRITKKSGGELVYEVVGTAATAEPLYNIVETPRGGQYQITLSDGSKVWLNAASSLKFPASFAQSERRRVELKGEAYFEIAHDKLHPFEVITDEQQVEVLGTHFNVNSYEDEPFTTTTLLEGSVKVTAGSQSKMIRPGQETKVREGIRLGQAADDAIAWKNGITSFDKADIKSIMRKVARWYDLDVQYEGAIPRRSFTGGISRKDDLSALTRILESSNIRYRLEGRLLTIMP